MTVKNIRIEPSEIKGVKGKGQSPGTSNFDAFMGAVDAMEPMNTELMYQATGSSNAAAVMHGAFTGVSGAAASYGVGTGTAGYGALSEYPGVMGVGSYGTYTGVAGKGTIPYTTGKADQTTQIDKTLLDTMNTNNLKLLELQAIMQSNMQAWNTKSNILSADHRARMAMIEKFSARG